VFVWQHAARVITMSNSASNRRNLNLLGGSRGPDGVSSSGTFSDIYDSVQ
jgi:hypothetical protein